MALRNCPSCSFMKSYFFVVLLAAFTVRFFPSYSAALNFLATFGIPTFLYKKSPYELGYRNYLRGFLWGVSASATLLPLYALACVELFGAPFHLGTVSFSLFLFYLMVAVGEETFFRGFFYSSFENEWIVKGVLSKNNLVSSVLFGAAHALVYYDPTMFKVFFPSLVMGWLYERSDSLIAPIIFHLCADLLYLFVRC